MNTSRRDFLKTLATGSTVSVLSMLTPIEAVFQEKLTNTFPNNKLPTKNDYTLSKGVKYLNHGSIGTIPKIVQEAHQNYLSAVRVMKQKVFKMIHRRGGGPVLWIRPGM